MQIYSSHYLLKRNAWKAIYLLAYLVVFIPGTVFAQSQLGVNTNGRSLPGPPDSGLGLADAGSTGLIFKNGFERDPTAVAISGFSASPDSILVTGSTTLSWLTENAASCTPSGGTGGWDLTNIGLPDGNTLIEIFSAGDYEFVLDCTGIDGDTISASTNVLVSVEQTECTEPSLEGSVITWANLWGREFPLPTGAKEPLNLSYNGYKAIKFTTTSEDDRGLFATIPNVNANGAKFGAISECPGDFDVLDTCWEVWGTGSLIWNTGADPQNDCALKKDTTYYFNLTFTNGDDPDSSTCDSSRCITTVQTINPTE